jgi:nitrite reductase/ring-hydroxylating ferredoxin subunit/uncharacterized membrane protein
MKHETILDAIARQEWLGKTGDTLQPAVMQAFAAGGPNGQKVKDFLHGTWLGHPLHPAITDVPIGAWTTAAALDVLALCGQQKLAPGADAAVAIGLVGALGAAATGLTDWTGTTQRKRKIGLLHGLLNLGATALYATSYVLRRKGVRAPAIGLSMAGYGVTITSAYLGASLVFSEQMGVDHTATSIEYPTEFIAVLPEAELAEDTMQRVEAGEVPVLLARKNGEIFAIAHTCSHLGGPLSKGTLLPDGSVRCPWHGSVFSLADGRVLHGPATEPQPTFDVRVTNGQIEVRRAQSAG